MAMAEVSLDALPYVDTLIKDAGMQDAVNRLIEAEMKTFKPRDYLVHLTGPTDINPAVFFRLEELSFPADVYCHSLCSRLTRRSELKWRE